MEGYVFIGSGLDEVRYFRLEGTKAIDHILATMSPSGLRVLRVVPDRDILQLKRQLRQEVSSYLSEGSRVTVTQGVYARLVGIVVDSLEDDPENILVSFSFRSLERISKVPRAFLEPLGHDQALVE